jgi:hypothetical protein
MSFYEENKPPVTTSISCHKCGKVHEENSINFRVVYGDITVGIQGGIVGGNFDANGDLFRSMAFCTECLVELITKV